jgi:hypothetical protein
MLFPSGQRVSSMRFAEAHRATPPVTVGSVSAIASTPLLGNSFALAGGALPRYIQLRVDRAPRAALIAVSVDGAALTKTTAARCDRVVAEKNADDGRHQHELAHAPMHNNLPSCS